MITVSLLSCPSYGGGKLVARAAAMCTRAKNADKARDAAVKSGHDSILEHACYTFEITGVSRSLLAQLTRHRLASYSVLSQRYVDQSQAHVIVPESIKNSDFCEAYMDEVNRIRYLYDEMVSHGIPKEDARMILPEGTETSLILTMNARELRHFFKLRLCNRAQWEIRSMAEQMLFLCRVADPEIFDDVGPSCITEGGCHEHKSCGKPRLELKADKG